MISIRNIPNQKNINQSIYSTQIPNIPPNATPSPLNSRKGDTWGGLDSCSKRSTSSIYWQASLPYNPYQLAESHLWLPYTHSGSWLNCSSWKIWIQDACVIHNPIFITKKFLTHTRGPQTFLTWFWYPQSAQLDMSQTYLNWLCVGACWRIWLRRCLQNNNIPELERFVMTFPPWFASTNYPKYTGFPKDSDIWWGSSSTMSPYNSFQSASILKTDPSAFGTLGSITNISFRLFYRKWKIRYSSFRCPTWGDDWYCDSNSTYIWISILPNSTAHLNIPISCWNQDTFPTSHSSIRSNLSLYPFGSGPLWVRSPIFNFLSSS